MTGIQQFSILKPFEAHLHLRDGNQMASIVPYSAKQFWGGIIMPNLVPPVTTVDVALAYRDCILAAVPDGMSFESLMTLYLTDNTPPEEIEKLSDSAFVVAVKMYPAGATTNSDAGVTDIRKCYGTIEAMEMLGVPLLIHGEVTDPGVDVFDREKVFIGRVLEPLIERFPRLRVVLEHVTTEEGVHFVRRSGPNVAATLTVHHLLINRNAIFQGGLRPHHYCLPVAKRERHRLALIETAVSGHPKFFLGTDSAPHRRGAKESACGCAGVFTAHAAIELCAEVFEGSEVANWKSRLEEFASINGPRFYGLESPTDTVTLVRQSWTVPDTIQFGDSELVPFRAGQEIHWRIKR